MGLHKTTPHHTLSPLPLPPPPTPTHLPLRHHLPASDLVQARNRSSVLRSHQQVRLPASGFNAISRSSTPASPLPPSAKCFARKELASPRKKRRENEARQSQMLDKGKPVTARRLKAAPPNNQWKGGRHHQPKGGEEREVIITTHKEKEVSITTEKGDGGRRPAPQEGRGGKQHHSNGGESSSAQRSKEEWHHRRRTTSELSFTVLPSFTCYFLL